MAWTQESPVSVSWNQEEGVVTATYPSGTPLGLLLGLTHATTTYISVFTQTSPESESWTEVSSVTP